MTYRHIPGPAREAAVADYHASGDTLSVVAARHNVSRTSLSDWVRCSTGVGYFGGWEVRGGVSYPLMPERRSA